MGGISFFILAALVVGLGALGALFWALASGQYDDMKGAAERILIDDDEEDKPES